MENRKIFNMVVTVRTAGPSWGSRLGKRKGEVARVLQTAWELMWILAMHVFMFIRRHQAVDFKKSKVSITKDNEKQEM